MKLFLPNLTIEDDLSGRHTKFTAQTQRAVSELAPLMGLMAGEADVVAAHEVPLTEHLPKVLQHVNFRRVADVAELVAQPDATLVPWGWTDSLRKLAMANGAALATSAVPSAKAVWNINSRRFNADFDRVLTKSSVHLPFGPDQFGCLCTDVSSWSAAVRQLEQSGFDRWVAKTQISHAGRQRLIGTGTELNSQQRGWLKKHLVQPGGVYVEPWVTPEAECGLQFDVTGTIERPDVHLVGVTCLRNDAAGRYRGSVIATDDRLEASWQEVIEHGRAICMAARKLGYAGPLGIDAFRFTLPNGVPATRLSNDINGRFTMGRLALHLRRCLQHNEYGLWAHFISPQTAEPSTEASAEHRESSTKTTPESVRIEETSPAMIAGRSVRQRTALLIGPNLKDLSEAARQLDAENA